jgi:hypothetical protein
VELIKFGPSGARVRVAGTGGGGCGQRLIPKQDGQCRTENYNPALNILMSLTRQEIAILCFLLAAVITGGIVRLCRKGWTPPPNPPSISAPSAGNEKSAPSPSS